MFQNGVLYMNKSMKQIADELKVDKQQVYRYIIKEKINEVGQDGKTKLYDETTQNRIAVHFKTKSDKSKIKSETNQNTLIKSLEAQIEALKNSNERLECEVEDWKEQCRIKDQQIKDWTGAAAQFSKQGQPQLLDKTYEKSNSNIPNTFFGRLKFAFRGKNNE